MLRRSFQLKLFFAGALAAALALLAAVVLATAVGDVDVQAVLLAALWAFGIALIGGAAAAYFMARPVVRRARALTDLARRYRGGDLTRARLDYGDDELGMVARALDEVVQELGGRMADLARDRGRMAAILAGMIEGVIVVDPQGRLQLANDAARQMLKLSDLAVGRPYVETIRHPAIADLVGAALEGESPASVQLSPPRDSSRTITARAAPTIIGAGAHGAIVVLHDITDLRRADQIRRDFVANVSHELRTPLTAVRGYLEALADDDVTAEERGRFLEIITRHTLRMERLVRDLLRLARLDAGQEVIDLVLCETRGLIHAVTSDLAASLEERDQRVEISIEQGAETVQADPPKLHDALRNLIANASTYGPEHGVIRVQARPSADCVCIAVSDEGPGIPEEDLTRVFERFYRVDKSRGRDPGGTGLGLAIVRHLVELHGGRVRAENALGGGAIVTIELRA